ncbi:Multidrug efflux pump subunit AcrB [endosymbiont of Ridgeia piscesae]|jgi:multidrug efflux pump subunit AcrB|uniref:Multidrug efflux pump subunit AcrB n=3 Tax=endosymbiont of Ridgeia piscesae TaxID=54398 RepID=A0A0T5YWH2_9GAMM|nr:efflux RND transporter permease subunit [endosymbiont of Ridgeia piscesae]KRT54863.1 Multidrug efflux pump subunit AcrB [endosymbiont of Ridgeia piscesae]
MSQNDDHNDQLHSMDPDYEAHLGIAGRTARFFIESPLSPLFFIAMMMMGLMGLMLTPRQEDPQISVPMVDIFVQYPGAAAEQVSSLAIEPLERIMSEIPRVKHVYSAAQRGGGVVTIEFEVGEEMGASLVKVNDKLDSNMDKIPPGVMPPLVKAKGIDDVPAVNLTLWSKDMDGDSVPDVDDGQLRMLAHDVLQSIKQLPDTGSGFVVGGRREQMTVEVYPERLSGFNISIDQVAQTIKKNNIELQAGGIESDDSRFNVTTGAFLRSADDINRLMVGMHNDVPVYVHDVARVTQGPEDAKQLVAYYTGKASNLDIRADGVPAVTIAIAKKEGSNGVTVASSIISRVNKLKGTLIPNNVAVSITRDYGKTADDKVSDLIFKLFVATGFVFLLVLAAFRAFRPAIVVVLVIPVVLLMTIFSAWLMGYTIDRVSLFALIFSIGILVDDAIVVVENIYRRWLEEGKTDVATAVDAVREVGNPTILATFTVIAALLPMGFVSGMMGPYMEPIPALGSSAMLISVFAAFVFTPYLTMSHWLRPSMRYLKTAGEREHKEAERLERMFRRVLVPMIETPSKARLFRLVMWGTFLFACSFFYFNWVAVKMLPLDNKPEFAVVLDMPEGTALPVTANLAHRMAEAIRVHPEVMAVQVYAGTARPFDFNGMVRHYYLRQDPWQAEVQVQLTHKGKRAESSHDIAVYTRRLLTDMTEKLKRQKRIPAGVKFSVVEMPPGPPVLQSVVAEVHGPNQAVRHQVASELTEIFSRTESLRDVDNYMRDPYKYWRFEVDTEKAVRRGISVETINRNLAMALGGAPVGDVKQRAGHEPINIVIQVPLAERSEVTRLGDLPVHSDSGITVPLRELGQFVQVTEEPIIYHKDLRDVEYVVAEVGGKLAAPVYGMFQVQDLLKEDSYISPDGVALESFWLGPPKDDTTSAIEWAGEWTVTYETFRDMGAAFMVALVLIYVLVVWEFGNFRIPALIMAPIPLTLLGIIPAHFVFFHFGAGGEFTATSMIGWIALAGIIVRNSILLVDFSIHQIQQGEPVVEAVIQSCKTRTRPILITAFALVAGSSVIFFDPIFQGMAISLASGVLVSTVLTLIVIPLGCIKASKDLVEVAAATCPAGVTMKSYEELMPGGTAAAMSSAQPKLVADSPPLWIGVWGKLITIVTMLFYFVRGIVLLLMQLFRKKPSREKGAPAADNASPPPSSGSGGAGGADRVVAGLAEVAPASASTPTAADAPARVEAEPAKIAAQADAVDKVSGATRQEGVASEAPELVAEAVQPDMTASGEPAAEAAQSEPTPKVPAKAQPKAKKRPSTLKKKVVKPKAVEAVTKSAVGVNSAVALEAGDAPSRSGSAPAKKKGGRRGIRLKG